MSELRIAIVGHGRMGRAIEQLAQDRGIAVATVLDRDTGGITAESLNGATVALEFSEPAAAPANIRALARAGCRMVVGTTGWYDRMPEVQEEVLRNDGAMFWAPNFSVGVQVMLQLARRAGALVAKLPEFDAHVIETHHAAKKDRPSGTAAAVSAAASEARGGDVPITSVRTGQVPGTHDLVFDAAFEQIRIVHTARDRRVFAAGALRAAEWIQGRKGIFTMTDMISEMGESR